MLAGIRGDAFHAWCHLRQDERTFYFDRIQNGEVIRISTGEVIPFAEWRKQLRAMRRT
jgi:predicted DNA-binding transcriptional regulator YafY